MNVLKKNIILNLTLFLILFIFFSNIYVYASSNVFISTFPYKADIYINNVFVGKSPIVMVNLNNGKYSIKIEKEGYQTYTGKFQLKEDKTYNFTFSLIPATFSFLVNNNFSIEVGNKKIDSPFIVKNLKPGVYKISIKRESIKITPDNFYKNLKWITLASALISGGLYSYFEIFKPSDPYMLGLYDGLKYTFLATGAISTGISIYSFIMDNKLKDNFYDIDSDPVLNEDKVLFYQGLNLLNKGKLDDSLDVFKYILEKYKDSRYFPSSLYYIGYIYEKKKKLKFAINYYEKLIYEYPVYEWYDITLLTTAKIYYENGIYSKSLYLLNNILFVDKLIVSEDIVARFQFLNYYKLIKSGRDIQEYTNKLEYYYNLFNVKYSESNYKYEIFYFYAKHLIDIGEKKKALEILRQIINQKNNYTEEANELYKENI